MGIFTGHKPRWSVATVLTLTMLVVISLFMSITTFTEIRREQAIFRVHIEELGLIYLNAVRQVYIETGGKDESNFTNLVDRAGTGRGMPEISQLHLYSETGETLVAHLEPGEEIAFARPTSNWPSEYSANPVFRHNEDYLDVNAPIVSDGALLGFVHFRMSSSAVENAIQYLAISALVQAVLLIAIAIPITYFVAQRFTRPIKTLARAAESIGAGHLDEDMLPVYKQNDEIGDLNVAFSGMVEALRESRRKLERAQERNVQSARMVAVDKLANGVAHEINNPLASILGFAQLGKQKMAKFEGETVNMDEISFVDRYLGFVEKEARRCGQIISRMLSFTLSPEQNLTPTDVNLQVEQVIRMNVNQLGQAGVTPKIHLGESLPSINAEATSLIRVFDHVLLNAIKAMPSGGTLRVSTYVRRESSALNSANVVVEFQDTGTGISSDDVTKVFDPFFTTAEPGRGTGLGLYVAYQIIKQHGAEIEIVSKQGEGTTVTMTFPELVPADGADDGRIPVEWV